MMQPLTTDLISHACRVFLSLAYPGGEDAVPAKRRHLLGLPAGRSILEQLSGDAALQACCQVSSTKTGAVRSVLLRLGCTHYPHLKLKANFCDHDDGGLWILSVDTHDAFSAKSFVPPPDHPDAAAWGQLQTANAALKARIETAWEEAGLLTFNALLRRELQEARPSGS